MGLSVETVWRVVDSQFQCDALFNTYCFVVLFLPLVLLGYWAVPRRTWKLGYLTAMSLLFYALWDVRFVPLLLASAVVDFVVAQRIEAARLAGADRSRAKAWLIVSIAFNLSVLAFFKYAMFFAENARSIFDLAGIPVTIPGFTIVLPVGISFYTFQTLSYTIDVYRGQVPATRNFLKYTCYVTMFPQLVAGPIVRYAKLDEQLDALPARPHRGLLVTGASLFILGLAKKILVADTVARFVEPLWADPHALTTVQAWYAALGYTIQLYFDFSGYSDMAIGLGAMMALRFPINFNAPYQAVNISDFWRRWHISLSTFLRDYLYIPLGGNRLGARRAQINMMIVMFLGGLWHGANWTFVVWGVYHGFLLASYRQVQPWWDRMHVAGQRAATLFLVVIGWVVFRANSLGDAGAVYRAMFFGAEIGLEALTPFGVLLLLGIYTFMVLARPTSQLRMPAKPWHAAVLSTLLLATMVMMGSGQSPFLYYQF